MLKNKSVINQLNQAEIFNSYYMQLRSLAEGVFLWENLPAYLPIYFLNEYLVSRGSVAWFYDDILNQLIFLPYTIYDWNNVYGIPSTIQVLGYNGYSRVLKADEYVIMYDNSTMTPILGQLREYARDIAQARCILKKNIYDQKNIRFVQTTPEKEQSTKSILNKADSLVDNILVYDTAGVQETFVDIAPVPFVGDKLRQEIKEIWSEALRLIGISTFSMQKKERMIQDEVQSQIGGAVAFRYNRLKPRKDALEQVYNKFPFAFEQKPEVTFYDKLDSEEITLNDFLEMGAGENEKTT